MAENEMGVERELKFACDNLEAVRERLADLEAEEFDLVSPVTGAMGEVRLALSGDREEDKPTVVVYTFHRPLTEGGQAPIRDAEIGRASCRERV